MADTFSSPAERKIFEKSDTGCPRRKIYGKEHI
jgi:hypothetical protein